MNHTPAQYIATQAELNAAFNRAKLHQLGYTLRDAMQNKALNIGLTHMAQAAQKPIKTKKQSWQPYKD